MRLYRAMCPSFYWVNESSAVTTFLNEALRQHPSSNNNSSTWTFPLRIFEVHLFFSDVRDIISILIAWNSIFIEYSGILTVLKIYWEITYFPHCRLAMRHLPFSSLHVTPRPTFSSQARLSLLLWGPHLCLTPLLNASHLVVHNLCLLGWT